MLNSKNIIRTKRLILRPFTIDDAESMFNNWASDNRIAKLCQWEVHPNIRHTEKIIKNIFLKNPYLFCIEFNDEPIGSIGATNIFKNTVEIGYCISYKNWNKGIMTEALKAIIAYFFEKGFNEVFCQCDIKNISSKKVMEKCGMKFDSIVHNKNTQTAKYTLSKN